MGSDTGGSGPGCAGGVTPVCCLHLEDTTIRSPVDSRQMNGLDSFPAHVSRMSSVLGFRSLREPLRPRRVPSISAGHPSPAAIP